MCYSKTGLSPGIWADLFSHRTIVIIPRFKSGRKDRKLIEKPEIESEKICSLLKLLPQKIILSHFIRHYPKKGFPEQN